MFNRFIGKMLAHRHPWRQVTFSELSELYTSVMLRSMGLSLIGIFIPIYLYKLGYAVPIIFLFFAAFFLARAVGDIVAGYMVAARGPKHVILYSYILQIISLMLLLLLPSHVDLLWVVAASWGVSNSLYFIGYNVDFSKILHSEHGGEELGFMVIMERLGGVLGPVAGGLIATTFGAQYTIAAAIFLLMFAVVPLFLTAEPVKLHQHIDFKLIPFGKLKADFSSFAAHTIENTLTVALWPLYLAVIIFTTNTYASIGFITSIGIVVAIFTARVIGQLIDSKKGGLLLVWAAIASAALHLVRPFIGSPAGAMLASATGETASTAYRLPYFRGMYDRADSLPGHRIAYIVAMEFIGDIGKITPWLILWVLSLFLSVQLTMQLGFLIASLAALLSTMQKFPALQR